MSEFAKPLTAAVEKLSRKHRETAAALLPVVLDTKLRKRDALGEQGVTKDG